MPNETRIARMVKTVRLIGTNLVLNKGQTVTVTPATNLPEPQCRNFFARALGWEFDHSILVEPTDIEIEK